MLGGKKFLLIGIMVVLLAAIPLTVFFLQQNQDTRSRAQAATTLFFANPGQLVATTATVTKAVGDSIPMDVIVDPGSNQVSFIKMSISYDATKLSVDQTNGVVQNPSSFPSILEGPTYTDGNISITLSIGADPTKVAQTPTKVATINFKAKESTNTTPTSIKFLDGQTQVLSIASSDQPSENVLASTKPANIAITGSATTTTTPAPTSATTTPSPTTAAGTSPTPAPTTTAGTNTSPTCTTLTAAPTTSGPVPFTVNFTANGTDSNGTISKATFNFGDGPVQDVTQSGGIGTATVSVQSSHVYNTVGTYQVSVVLTDNGGAVSGSTCTKTIIATAASSTTPVITQLPATGGGGNPAPTAVSTPRPTLPAAGPGDTVLKGGIFATVIAIVGAMMFFAL